MPSANATRLKGREFNATWPRRKGIQTVQEKLMSIPVFTVRLSDLAPLR
jgi:hypothetical protein